VAKKNAIHYYPPEIRKAIDKLLKEGGRTLDELLEQIHHEHAEKLETAGKEPPSRSSLGRYSVEFEKSIKEARELRHASRAWVNQVGEDPDSDTGKMLVEMMQSVTAKSLLAMKKDGVLEIDELKAFAQAVHRLSQSDAIQVKRAQWLKEEARRELIEEQKQKLSSANKSGLISAETLATIRSQLYGF
jgi:hypothetical protein